MPSKHSLNNDGITSSEHMDIRTEILTVAEMEQLPEGVCISSDNPEVTGSEVLGKFIFETLEKIPQTHIPSSMRDEMQRRVHSPEYLIGQICANYKYGGVYEELINVIDTQFPRLCWFRGGDYVETQSGSPALSEFLIIGANGYLGDTRAIRYAKKNYNSATHQNPVLYMVPLKSLINGINSNVIDLGTEHDYDVVVSRKGDGFDDWAIRNVIVIDLGNSKDDFEIATQILNRKSVVVQSNKEHTVPTKESEETIRETKTYQKKNGHFSPMELTDFDSFLRKTDPYRHSDFVTSRSRSEVPLSIIFFGENSTDEDLARFEIIEDMPRHAINVKCTQGDPRLIDNYLADYGFATTNEDLLKRASSEVVRLINDPLVLEFLSDRKIRETDRTLIEEALTIPRQIYIENHNTAPSKSENLAVILQQQIAYLDKANSLSEKDSDNLRYAQIMLALCEKYDWTVAWNLNTVMEKIAPKNIKN